MASASVPIVPFKKFGTQVKDLFKKKFDYDNQFKFVNKTSQGLSFEVNGVGSTFAGNLKAKHVKKGCHDVEVDLNTNVKKASKLTTKFTGLAKGATLSLVGSTLDDDRVVKFSKPTVLVTAEYAKDFFSAEGSVKTDGSIHKVETQGAVNFEGFSVGGALAFNATKGFDRVSSVIGAEYTKSDITVSLFTENNSDLVNAGYFQKINKSTSAGALVKIELTDSQSRSLTFGVEHEIDFDTSAKLVAELPKGVISLVLEHKLENPKILVNVAAQFNACVCPAPVEKFGLSLTFGDF